MAPLSSARAAVTFMLVKSHDRLPVQQRPFHPSMPGSTSASAPPPACALASSKSTTSPLLVANLRRLLYHGARVGEDRVGVDARLVERGGGASARERSRLDQGRQRGPAHQGSDARVSNR